MKTKITDLKSALSAANKAAWEADQHVKNNPDDDSGWENVLYSAANDVHWGNSWRHQGLPR